MKLVCCHCGKECKNRNSYINHERLCPLNLKRQYVNGMTGKVAWNSGRTKKDNNKVLQYAQTIKSNFLNGKIRKAWKGKHLSQATKDKLSKSRLKFLKIHPEMHPNNLLSGNRSRLTYPEQLVFNYLTEQKIEFINHIQIDRYWPDFVLFSKFIIEVDGERWHSNVKQKEYDKNRDNKLKSFGYVVYRIPAEDTIIHLKVALEKILSV
jgi:very-short-patch-repair endonuclease